MRPQQMTVQSVCNAHKDRRLDPKKRNHVLIQLQGEGHKRVESFLFEQIFARSVVQCLGQTDISFGWFFQYDEKNTPHYWFKLNSSANQWNTCDDVVVTFLSNTGCVIFSINYNDEEREFYAAQYSGSLWQPQQLLTDALMELTGKKAGVRNNQNIMPEVQRKAIDKINTSFSDAELYHLSLSRLLTNCYLIPWFDRQPMDIDVCCQVNNQIYFLEFKRKYPTRSGTFGIDKHPHISLAEWLIRTGKTLSLIILVDPLWNKDESPLHLLDEESVTAADAAWIGVPLNTSAFSGKTFSTSGQDSGMNPGNRYQPEIRMESFRMLGRGLDIAPDRLNTFLTAPASLPGVTTGELQSMRNTARIKYYRQKRQNNK